MHMFDSRTWFAVGPLSGKYAYQMSDVERPTGFVNDLLPTTYARRIVELNVLCASHSVSPPNFVQARSPRVCRPTQFGMLALNAGGMRPGPEVVDPVGAGQMVRTALPPGHFTCLL